MGGASSINLARGGLLHTCYVAWRVDAFIEGPPPPYLCHEGHAESALGCADQDWLLLEYLPLQVGHQRRKEGSMLLKIRQVAAILVKFHQNSNDLKRTIAFQ